MNTRVWLHGLLWTGMVALCMVPVLLCAVLIPVAWSAWKYGPETFKAAHDAASSIPSDLHGMTAELTADSKTIALDVHRDVVVAGGAEGETEKTMRLIRSEAPDFIAQGHQELSAIHDLTLDSRATLGEADKAIAAYEGIPAHINPLLDAATTLAGKLSGTAQGLTDLSTSLRKQVDDPENAKLRESSIEFMQSYARLGNTVNLTVDQGRKKWVAPCEGKHCRLRAVGKTALEMVGVGATVVRDTK